MGYKGWDSPPAMPNGAPNPTATQMISKAWARLDPKSYP